MTQSLFFSLFECLDEQLLSIGALVLWLCCLAEGYVCCRVPKLASGMASKTSADESDDEDDEEVSEWQYSKFTVKIRSL